MFDKFVISVLKNASAVVYAMLVFVVLSIPVIFIYQAFTPPVFTFNSVSPPKELTEDKYLSSIGEDPDEWQRIDYKITASSGEFSPYNYKIEEFTIEENEALETAEDYKVVIDEPLEFSNTEDDSFVLSLYVKCSEETDIEDIMESAEFKAVGYEKSFSEFSVEY